MVENTVLYLHERLSAIGDAPGTVAELHQKRVSYLIQLGKAMIAFDKDITKEKFVKERR